MTAHIAQAKRHEALGRLADRRLHRELAYVDGHWTASASGESFEVTDPASGASLAWVASLDAEQATMAVDAAARAFPGWRNRCQFSFACDGKKDVITSPKHYKIAQEIGMAVTAGKIFLPEVASSTHYYAQYVSPRWARSMEKMKKIGLHIFYRTYGGGWS